MKILPFGLRSSILLLSLPYLRPEFCVYCYAVVNLRLPRNYSPGFFGGTRGIDLPFVSYLSSPFGSDLSLKRTFRPILALLPFRDGGLKWTRTIDLTLIRRVL